MEYETKEDKAKDTPLDVRTRIRNKETEIKNLKAAMKDGGTHEQREQLAGLITDLAIMRTMLAGPSRPGYGAGGVEYRYR